MRDNTIQFFTEDITYQIKRKEILRRGIIKLITEKGFQVGDINIIFCSDRFLKRMNKRYLNHDYYTDVVAFDLSEKTEIISGDIFISLDRIRENARIYHVSVIEETARIICHGILHLSGMTDSTEELKLEMKVEEDKFLSNLYSV
ncbi:MAG: rRNA maturation RNase YbeY [Bacteroidales bacterium]|nr:rRNA maturation RNase YbeY [Bacteroidales bacterium]